MDDKKGCKSATVEMLLRKHGPRFHPRVPLQVQPSPSRVRVKKKKKKKARRVCCRSPSCGPEVKRNPSRPSSASLASSLPPPSAILVHAMATAVPAASLPLPRASSSPARRPANPSLRKRHCAVRPVAAACSAPTPGQLDNGQLVSRCISCCESSYGRSALVTKLPSI